MSFLRLNIRQKIILGLIIMCLANGGIALISYNALVTMREKIGVVEFADDLSNTILEIRRSEKNYLLFNSEENLADNRSYIDAALKMLEKAPTSITDNSVIGMLNQINISLRSYRERIEELAALGYNGNDADEVVTQIRTIGKSLIEESKLLATLERQQIISITDQLRKNIFSSAVFLILLAVGLFLFVTFKILLPLNMIEQTTAHIAEGNFEPLPVWNTRDEIQSLMEAFNRMVKELESRQDQLVQAQKLSSIGTLASGIAHQLNNPLNNISTSCQIVLEENEQILPFSKKMLTNIEQETIRARDIVRGLLEFSRNQEFFLQPVQLREVIDRALKLVSSQIPAGIELDVDVPLDITLDLDIHRMSETLINLLINAIQAMDGQGSIRIYIGPPSSPTCVCLIVEDTGPGIPEENLSRIFDPFYTTKGVSVGTGLGLYIVYGIVKKHHGDIRAESTPGEGTRFIISLPLSATHVCKKQQRS
jgi:two-component system NtrC family sensor kinase